MKAPVVLAALALAGAAPVDVALADAPAARPHNDCFLPSLWQGWTAPDRSTLYLRVNTSDIFQVKLSTPSDLLTEPLSHLVSDGGAAGWVCAPVDLDLSVVNSGFRDRLIIKSITKLGRDQVAALPKKYLP